MTGKGGENDRERRSRGGGGAEGEEEQGKRRDLGVTFTLHGEAAAAALVSPSLIIAALYHFVIARFVFCCTPAGSPLVLCMLLAPVGGCPCCSELCAGYSPLLPGFLGWRWDVCRSGPAVCARTLQDSGCPRVGMTRGSGCTTA
ncbi:hypothetical protein FKM82_009035 [Ascaphus truei]